MKKPAMTLWYSEDSATGVWSLKLLKSHASCSPATEGALPASLYMVWPEPRRRTSEYAHITSMGLPGAPRVPEAPAAAPAHSSSCRTCPFCPARGHKSHTVRA